MHWFLDPITKHYADFKGRASRKEYWMFILGTLIVYFSAGLIFVALGKVMLFVPLILIFMLGIMLPGIAIQVRRLHDIGWSGWWVLLSFVPYIGSLVLIVLCCLPSQVGTNKYGAHPYGVGAGEVGMPPQQSVEQQPQAASVPADSTLS